MTAGASMQMNGGSNAHCPMASTLAPTTRWFGVVCFTIPASITRVQSFVLSHPDAGALQIVPLHPLTCESFENTDYCSTSWDLANPKKFDGVYEYAVINPTAYDRFRPEYGRVMQNAIASGLQAWADNNPSISFVQVDRAGQCRFLGVHGTVPVRAIRTKQMCSAVSARLGACWTWTTVVP